MIGILRKNNQTWVVDYVTAYLVDKDGVIMDNSRACLGQKAIEVQKSLLLDGIDIYYHSEHQLCEMEGKKVYFYINESYPQNDGKLTGRKHVYAKFANTLY